MGGFFGRRTRPTCERFDARTTPDGILQGTSQVATHRYFSNAKQAETRKARVDRYALKILDGKGFRDR